MPTTILTWNVYHGVMLAHAWPAPMTRIQQIAAISMANNVDIICLQEVPQALLDPLVIGGNGIPAAGSPVMLGLNAVAGGAFLANYSVLQFFTEVNPNLPVFTQTTDGYLIMYRDAAFPGVPANLGYYNANNFVNLAGNHLRAPVTVDLTDNGGIVHTIMTWHAETGAAGAGWSLQILDALLGNANALGAPLVVAGDFNVRGNFAAVFGGVGSFPNWTNLFAVYPGPGGLQITGLDHILCSVNINVVLAAQLQFTSDAYHYPIAGTY